MLFVLSVTALVYGPCQKFENVLCLMTGTWSHTRSPVLKSITWFFIIITPLVSFVSSFNVLIYFVTSESATSLICLLRIFLSGEESHPNMMSISSIIYQLSVIGMDASIISSWDWNVTQETCSFAQKILHNNYAIQFFLALGMEHFDQGYTP